MEKVYRGQWRCAGILLFVMLIGACGYRGDLYLPDDKSDKTRQQDNKRDTK